MRKEVKLGMIAVIVLVVIMAGYFACSPSGKDEPREDSAGETAANGAAGSPSPAAAKPTASETAQDPSQPAPPARLTRTTPPAEAEAPAETADDAGVPPAPRWNFRRLPPPDEKKPESAVSVAARPGARETTAGTTEAKPTLRLPRLDAGTPAETTAAASTGRHTDAVATRSAMSRVYTVQAGDNGFISIARKPEVYGEARYWYLIEKANPTVQSNRLRAGQKLVIPPIPQKAPSPTPSAGSPGPGSMTRLPSGDGVYVVQAGDNPSTIATRFYGHEKHRDLIIEANPGMDPTKLRIGQKLVIPKMPPEVAATTRSAEPAVKLAPKPGQRVHVVRLGDNFSTLAREYYDDASLYPAIEKANPDVNPRNLSVGQEILIPSKQDAQRVAGSSSTGESASESTGGASPSGYVPGKPFFD